MYSAYADHQFSRPAPPTATAPPQPPLSIPPPPPSPSQGSEAHEDATFNLPGPPPISRIANEKAWALDMVQQPIRARMCGFGDKDRRPISPPPCVRLIIIDIKTKLEVNYEEYAEQLAKFVLHVDLVSLDTLEEKNLVRHNSTSPSISSVATTSYPMTTTNAMPAQSPLPQYNINKISAYNSQNFNTSTSSNPTTTTPSSSSAGPNVYQSNGLQQPPQQQQPYYGNGASQYGRPTTYPYGEPRYPVQYGSNGYQHSIPQLPPMQTAESTRHGSLSSSNGGAQESRGMFTRNLIGSLSASAFKLEDLDGKTGLFFVFQDLSIRTEGWFRLKMSFFDIGDHSHSEDEEASKLAELAPLLAMIYSKPFRVYSAKKFPGVIESTDLSKKFALQGIKIPIRKDTNAGGKRRRDDDSEGGDDQDDDEQ